MSTDVQTVPKAENLMDRSNSHTRRKQNIKLQQSRQGNTVASNTVTASETVTAIENTASATVAVGTAGQPSNATQQLQHKKNKHDADNRHFKTGRKRLQSFNGNNTKFFPPYKRRKKEGAIVPPTKFLLGGNICDPLNLNSLQDEEINRAMNAVTPKSSPLPTPTHRKGQVEVIIPPDIHDPLSLNGCKDNEEYEAMLISPLKRNQKKQKKSKRRKHSRSLSGAGSGKEDTADEARSGDEKKMSESEDLLTSHSVARPKCTDLNSAIVRTGETVVTEAGGTLTVEEASDDVTGSSSAPVATNTQNIALGGGGLVDKSAAAKTLLNLDLEVANIKSSSSSLLSPNAPREKRDSQDNNSIKKLRKELKDKIVSPVIPQPGAWGDPRNHWYRPPPHRMTPQINKGQATPKFKENNARFQFGNYNRYYGYRNANEMCDVRFKVLAKRKDLFEGKDVLDVGCNVGHVTLAIARDLSPKKIVGIDIDRSLIEVAKKNIRHYMTPRDKHYPVSMPVLYGPVSVPLTSTTNLEKFPNNISFVQGNYVLESDVLLTMEHAQFDVILCLSVTKWFHLNWGDEGLKRAFKRMYSQLRPGGVLILEPQPWHSYKKKRNLTPQIWGHYKNIELFPHKFSQYLLSEVGFTKCETIGAPWHQARGFQRPIKLFTKGEMIVSNPSSKRIENDREMVIDYDVLELVPAKRKECDSVDEALNKSNASGSESSSTIDSCIKNTSVEEKRDVNCKETPKVTVNDSEKTDES